MDWSAVTHAGAFIVGVLAGTIMTTRLARVLAQFLRRERDQ